MQPLYWNGTLLSLCRDRSGAGEDRLRFADGGSLETVDGTACGVPFSRKFFHDQMFTVEVA